MIAIFDIGNTNITLGLFEDNRIIDTIRFKTSLIQNIKDFSFKLKTVLKKYQINDVFIGSVVPEATGIIRKLIKRYLNIKSYTICENTKLNIKNKYKNKREAGDDRIANAVAAAYYFKNQHVIVIDFGTATTFDIINNKAEYLGGLIFPGIGLCLRCLAKNTARLPEVKIVNIKKAIGNTTQTSIISGITNGFTGAIKYILEKIKKELKIKNTKIILTGGEADLIKINISTSQIMDKNFTLKGFKIIYDLNKRMN